MADLPSIQISKLPSAGIVKEQDIMIVNQLDGEIRTTRRATVGQVFSDAIEDAQSAAQAAARSALEAAQSAADSAGLQRPYKDVPTAQAAIDAGTIADGAVFSIIGTDPNVSYEFYFNNAGVATPILDVNGKPKTFPNFIWYLQQLKNLDFNATQILPNAGYVTYAGVNAFEVTSVANQLALFLDSEGKMGLPSGSFDLGSSQFMPIPESSEYALAYTDELGATVFGIGKAGWVEILGMRLYKEADRGAAIMITDQDGHIAAEVSDYGQTTIYDLKGGGGGGEIPDPFLEFAERMHLFIYGQSLSNGAIGVPVLNTPTSDALMFNTGVRSTGYTPTSFVDLRETQAGTNGETIASGLAHGFVAKSGGMYDRKLILNSGGLNAAAIAAISKGTANYNNALAQLRWAGAQSAEAGLEYSVDFMFYLQGEADMSLGTPVPTYVQKYKQLRIDLSNDTASIRKPGRELVMLTYQTSSHGYYVGSPGNPPELIAQAQLDVALTEPNIDMWGPTYMGLPGNHTAGQGNVHHNNHGYRIQGLYAQKALRHRLRTRTADKPEGEKYLPLHATDATKINARTVVVSMHVPFPPLVIDSSLVTELPDGNHGVELHDSTGRLAIESVTIVGGTKIKVVSSVDIGEGAFVAFAWTPDNRGPINNNRHDEWFFGRETGVRTTIHDSDPEVSDLTDERGLPYALHNYCAIQKIEVL